jgi:hypothetical protein
MAIPASPAPGPAPETAPPAGHGRPAELIEYSVSPEEEDDRAPVLTAPAAGQVTEESTDSSAEGLEEAEGDVGADATVLVLESGEARVGVLWDQVAQVGSLTTPMVPPRIDTERGSTDLVSLGLLLHGLSREEKYFVVLEQDGERAAVACERMLGLGPELRVER